MCQIENNITVILGLFGYMGNTIVRINSGAQESEGIYLNTKKAFSWMLNA
jgi:hypothetical protein